MTACGEDVDIVMNTVKAACVMEYPRDRFRVILTDDGADSMLRAEVLALQTEIRNLCYYAREKKRGEHHGFKAGNINNAIRHAATLEGPPGEFCVVLDADMIPEGQLLRTLLGHIVNEPRVAMAVPPQAMNTATRIPVSAKSVSALLQYSSERYSLPVFESRRKSR